MKNKLSKAYKKLDLREYKNIVEKAEGLIFSMPVYDYENELIVTLKYDSEFQINKHYVNGHFYGFNVYTQLNGVLNLIDTKNKKKHAERLIKTLKHALEYRQQRFDLPY